MLSNARVVPTLAVSDMERARHFYEDRLGLAVEADVVGTVRYSCGRHRVGHLRAADGAG